MKSSGPVVKLSSPATGEFWPVPVVFEDANLLALNKPAGLLTSPDRYDRERPNLMKLLHRDVERKAPWAEARGLDYLANAHRLDFETSGVILLSKDKPTLVALANQFGTTHPEKVYVALVQGVPETESFEVDLKLAGLCRWHGLRYAPKYFPRLRWETLLASRTHAAYNESVEMPSFLEQQLKECGPARTLCAQLLS
jgi:hypothetical protein